MFMPLPSSDAGRSFEASAYDRVCREMAELCGLKASFCHRGVNADLLVLTGSARSFEAEKVGLRRAAIVLSCGR